MLPYIAYMDPMVRKGHHVRLMSITICFCCCISFLSATSASRPLLCLVLLANHISLHGKMVSPLVLQLIPQYRMLHVWNVDQHLPLNLRHKWPKGRWIIIYLEVSKVIGVIRVPPQISQVMDDHDFVFFKRWRLGIPHWNPRAAPWISHRRRSG